MVMAEQTKKSKENFFQWTGYTLGVGAWLILLYIFLKAYFNNPEKQTMVKINEKGEAHIELTLFLTCFVIILIGCYYAYRDYVVKKVF